jgi:putative nucleotidyltransferase with HDIG domain
MEAKKRIGELLVWEGLVTEEQVKEALDVQKKQGGKIVGILINLGYLKEETFLQFLSRQGLPSINIGNYELQKQIVKLIPADFARKHEMLALDKLGKLLTVAMVCPLDRVTLDELSKITGLKIKPILCSAADVREAIARYYGKREAAVEKEAEPVAAPASPAVAKGPFRLTGVIEIVKRVEALPTLPAVLERIRQAMTDPFSSAGDIARIVSTDPSIASKLLQVANSAAYGFSRKIGDIKHAIALLGLRETYQIALSVGAIDVLAKDKKFDYQRFRKHSSQCAAAAHALARKVGAEGKVGIFATGLLHDIGKLVLVDLMSERYNRIAARIADEKCDSVSIEEEEVGVSHAEVGFLLADHWQFPHEMAEAIRFHHKPELAEKEPLFTAIIAFADRIVNDVAAGKDAQKIAPSYPKLLAALALTPQSAGKLIKEYANKSEKVEVL